MAGAGPTRLPMFGIARSSRILKVAPGIRPIADKLLEEIFSMAGVMTRLSEGAPRRRGALRG